jgi:hypothetical protein
VAQYPPVARQSIPRFDLYGELGVEPSADTDAIEAAYHALIDRQPDAASAANIRSGARLRVAREWLMDPERRNRYDASRARAAARAEKAADAEARELAGAASEEASGTSEIPWPARDLDRPAAGIEWSSTPEGALAADAPSKTRARRTIGAVTLIGLAAIVGVATYVLAFGLPSTDVADREPTPSPPAQTIGAQTASPPPEPTAAPTVVPTTAPTPGATEAAPEVAAMQNAAWATIEALKAAAASGDVAAAQPRLGGSAPGLRASGLRRATFPLVGAEDIGIQREGELYVALAGADRLTSADGLTWTFDYGDRPLAAYRSPGAEPLHDLWWVESDGEHHLYLRVAVATISRSGVTADVRWSFDPSRPDDATYFQNAGLVLSMVDLGGVDYLGATEGTGLITGLSRLTLVGTLDAGATVAPELRLGLTVTNPRTIGGDPRLIDTVWTLAVR